uniref:Uncharacterized protein AlNc14C10G1298 n=1 Tax=Albugo laibachii Nc14 TaxID=890382 RepID=F0W2R0_9STRA|nr:conserved hypothetical protein [Albugo laibachii Nc14]|eukprot:CCA15346.1 conserved hypothetical protein [Albugo laibachii Nc14]
MSNENDPENVIDVSSDSPALLQDDKTVLYPSPSDLPNVICLVDEEDQRADEQLEEYEYPHGLHSVPIHSPAQLFDEEHDDIILEERTSNRASGFRNRKLFFLRASNARNRSKATRNPSLSTGNGRILRSVIFRKRSSGTTNEMDAVFWTGIFISSLFSLAIMSALVLYLTQTDFFASHQNDLFGATVDNRFTVIASEKARAKILLKSGYSNSRYSQAMVAFGNGVLQLGRRASSLLDSQSFYGLSLLSNGTALFTNTLIAPAITSDFIRPRKALVFKDGTSMTTAANISGGMKAKGDLNVVSTKGVISLSSGSHPRVVVQPNGVVVFLNSNAEDPFAGGIAIASGKKSIRIANDFILRHNGTLGTLQSSALYLNTSAIWLGNDDNKVIVSPLPHKKSIEMEFRGQHDGGSMLFGTREDGGHVTIHGGMGRTRHGTISLNAQLDPYLASLTVIGSNGSSHTVQLHGNIAINADPVINGNLSVFHVASAKTVITSDEIDIGSVNSSIVLDAALLAIGRKGTREIAIGHVNQTNLSLYGTSVHVNGNQVFIGDDAKDVQVRSLQAKNQSIRLASSSLSFMADSLSMNTTSANLFGTFRFFGKNKAILLEMDNDTVVVSSPVARIKSDKVAIEAVGLSIGQNELNSSVKVFGAELKTHAKVIAMGDSARTTSMTLAGQDISIGQETRKLAVGSKETIKLGLSGVSVDIDAQDNVTIKSKSLELSTKKARVDADSVSLKSRDISIRSQKITIHSDQLVLGDSSGGISIGHKASEVHIGGSDAKIWLDGEIFVNGKTPETQSRRLSTRSPAFFVVEKTGPLPARVDDDVVLIWLNAFGSADVNWSASRDTLTVFEPKSFVKLSFSMNNVRVNGRKEEDASARLRYGCNKLINGSFVTPHSCRVYREPTEVLMKSTIAMDVCSDPMECIDGFFTSLQAQKIVSIKEEDTLGVACVISGASAQTHELLFDDAQFSVEWL